MFVGGQSHLGCGSCRSFCHCHNQHLLAHTVCGTVLHACAWVSQSHAIFGVRVSLCGENLKCGCVRVGFSTGTSTASKVATSETLGWSKGNMRSFGEVKERVLPLKVPRGRKIGSRCHCCRSENNYAFVCCDVVLSSVNGCQPRKMLYQAR